MPDVYIEAEFADGFILREDEADQSPYDESRNIFYAILHGHPVEEHGKMVRFSVVMPVLGHAFVNITQQFNVDWTKLPDNARPIRFKRMERSAQGGEWVTDATLVGLSFGYQYTDEDGKNQQELIEFG